MSWFQCIYSLSKFLTKLTSTNKNRIKLLGFALSKNPISNLLGFIGITWNQEITFLQIFQKISKKFDIWRKLKSETGPGIRKSKRFIQANQSKV